MIIRHCIICSVQLKGKQNKFCSNQCKHKSSNNKFQNYVTQQQCSLRRKLPNKKILAFCLGLQLLPFLFNHFFTSAAFPNAIALQIAITTIMCLLFATGPITWLYLHRIHTKKQQQELCIEQSRVITDLAKNNNGVVDVSVLAKKLNMSKDDAEKLLTTWIVSGMGLNLEVSDEGELIYVFPTIREDRLKVRFEHLAEEIEDTLLIQGGSS